MYDYLIVGTGLFGSIFAREAQSEGKSVLVIDKRPNIGGNIFTEKIPNELLAQGKKTSSYFNRLGSGENVKYIMIIVLA